MKRMISVLLCAVLLLPIVSALPLQASAATTIEHISLTLEYPEAGKAPAGAVCNGRGYSVWDVEWFDRTDDRYLQPGDKIVTIGGFTGRILSIKDDEVTFETGAAKTRLTIKKWAIQTREGPEVEAPVEAEAEEESK